MELDVVSSAGAVDRAKERQQGWRAGALADNDVHVSKVVGAAQNIAVAEERAVQGEAAGNGE